MKLAVSADGESLDAMVDPRFGRCGYFIVIEPDDLSFQAYENANAELQQSAGIQAASFVASTGVGGVLTGSCGPKAMDVLVTANIQVFTGHSGTVREAVERYRQGGLEAGTASTVGGGQCDGRGTGGGRGMGGGGRCMGGGQGMGGGRGMGQGAGGYYAASSTKSSQTGTLADLKAQAAELQRQMEAITSRIEQMEK